MPPTATSAEQPASYCPGFEQTLGRDWAEPEVVADPEEVAPIAASREGWDNLGLRGQVAKLLLERGYEKQAGRFANCQRFGRPGVCSRYPEKHKYFQRHGCGMRFCINCALEERRRLFTKYHAVFSAVLTQLKSIPYGWVFARVTFNLRSDGSAITPEKVKLFNSAVRRVHGDAKRDHDAAITRLHAEYNRLQSRIDAMYVDKLDGRIDADFFDRKACEWRKEQDLLLRSIQEHQTANQTYLKEGVRLLELAQRAHTLFQEQEPREKRRLLNFLLSNCSWQGGKLTAVFRQPFDMLVNANSTHRQSQESAASSGIYFENWLGGLDSNFSGYPVNEAGIDGRWDCFQRAPTRTPERRLQTASPYRISA